MQKCSTPECVRGEAYIVTPRFHPACKNCPYHRKPMLRQLAARASDNGRSSVPVLPGSSEVVQPPAAMRRTISAIMSLSVRRCAVSSSSKPCNKRYYSTRPFKSQGRGLKLELFFHVPSIHSAQIAPKSAYTGLYLLFYSGGCPMDEKTNILIPHPEYPVPKQDGDDLIFQHEYWLTSDR